MLQLKRHITDGISFVIACFLLFVGLDVLISIVSGYQTVLITTPKESSLTGLFLMACVYLFMSCVFFVYACRNK